MTFLQWVLLVWMVAAISVGGFAAWFGWHLRRGRHTRHADRSESSGRPVGVIRADTPPRIPHPRD